MSLELLTEMSNRYGSDEEYVLAGGGNTSFKENGVLYVKGSGARLANITPELFVAMDIRRLLDMAGRGYPADMGDDEREDKALADMMAARLPGEEKKRPSVEAILHAVFPYKYVLHVHPALINGVTCGLQGKAACERLLGEKAVWIGLFKPGFILARECYKVFCASAEKNGVFPQVALLQNHGVFIAADSVKEIDRLMEQTYISLKSVTDRPDFSETGFDRELACSIAPALRMLYSGDGMASAVFCANKQVSEFVSDAERFKELMKPFTPDHIVYCKDEPLFMEPAADYAAEFAKYAGRKGYPPKIAAIRGLGFFALGQNRNEAFTARDLFLDAIKIAVYTRAFGGINPLTDGLTNFILNWESEKYRANASLTRAKTGRLDGRIVLVTGGAQGFGKGIAESLAAEGAYAAVADLNAEGAAGCASGINTSFEPLRAVSIEVDVTNEESVKRMVQETVLAFGGLDVLISNAGVVISGSLADMTKKSFDFVTSVNYTGYFLCTKYAAIPMKIQNRHAPGYFCDIIEINSKSGLEGSNKNFAYAGSKFGGVGLTQSFALELVEYGIKVNAICPGNFLDGPLWSGERGLFRQYLESGKVPGAKTIADVRKFYESKVPMKRGCAITDVARAILYVIEQQYETGQSIPVTGGQVMLN